jgi:hypothetical protein
MACRPTPCFPMIISRCMLEAVLVIAALAALPATCALSVSTVHPRNCQPLYRATPLHGAWCRCRLYWGILLLRACVAIACACPSLPSDGRTGSLLRPFGGRTPLHQHVVAPQAMLATCGLGSHSMRPSGHRLARSAHPGRAAHECLCVAHGGLCATCRAVHAAWSSGVRCASTVFACLLACLLVCLLVCLFRMARHARLLPDAATRRMRAGRTTALGASRWADAAALHGSARQQGSVRERRLGLGLPDSPDCPLNAPASCPSSDNGSEPHRCRAGPHSYLGLLHTLPSRMRSTPRPAGPRHPSLRPGKTSSAQRWRLTDCQLPYHKPPSGCISPEPRTELFATASS